MLTVALLVLAGPPLPPVTAAAFSADGTLLAAGTRGTAHLFAADGRPLAELPGQTGRVTAVAFGPTLLAVASGDPGRSGLVRLFDLRDPARPQPVGDPLPAHKDSVHALAVSPDGRTLLTGGYDRTVKLWDLPPKPTPRHTLTDHSDAVHAAAFHPGGKLLATAAADRTVKVWDVASGKRLFTLGEPTDAIFAVAWHPDGRHLHAAGADKSVRTWAVTPAGGTLVKAALAHDRPVRKLVAAGGRLWTVADDRTVKAFDPLTLAEAHGLPPAPADVLSLAVRPDGKRAAVGRFDGTLSLLDLPAGTAVATPLPAPPKPPTDSTFGYPIVPEADAPDAQPVTLPATVAGRLDRTGDADTFRLTATAGQQIGLVLTPADPTALDATMRVTDAAGRVLAEAAGTKLGFVAPAAGPFAVTVRDRQYRGGVKLGYRLHLGPLPVVTGVFPLGVARGATTPVTVSGVNLPVAGPVPVSVPADAAVGSRVAVPGTDATVSVGEFPAVTVSGGAATVPVPGTADGTLVRPGEAHAVRFPAKKGTPLVVEVHADRLGSPLDPLLEVHDAAGQPVPRAVLRAVARASVTLRDHPATKPGIRLDAWPGFAVDDFVLMGTEVMRIKELPLGPDDDTEFYQQDGKRLAFLGTTPTAQAFGTDVFKVAVEPPGAAVRSGGTPAVTVPFRNDDAGVGFGRDSWLRFDPPADGDYRAVVRDGTGLGGPRHSYRLTVRPPRPDFAVTLSAVPKVPAGGAATLLVTATRADGFDGPIRVTPEVSAPYTAPPTTIEAGQLTAVVPVSVAGKPTGPGPAVRATASADVGGRTVTHAAAGGRLAVADPVDLTATTDLQEVVLKPGGTAKLTVRVRRLGAFAGRVQVDVRGLPHGVRVDSVGLSGVLLPPGVSERQFTLSADPWVRPTGRPFAVVARVERKSEFAVPVLLRVE